jgi:hypothetical protein
MKSNIIVDGNDRKIKRKKSRGEEMERNKRRKERKEEEIESKRRGNRKK